MVNVFHNTNIDKGISSIIMVLSYFFTIMILLSVEYYLFCQETIEKLDVSGMGERKTKPTKKKKI